MGRVPFGIIYKITNKLNSKVYIGQTTQKLSKRQLIDIDIERKLKLKKKNATSQYRGVVSQYGTHTAYFTRNGRTICLGVFTDEKTAFAAYKAAYLEKYHRPSPRR